jgi:hypothetical protein
MGQPCVCKWFQTKCGVQYENTFFAKDINAVDKAVEIITQWNDASLITGMVRLNRPQVWEKPGGRPMLVEPFIEGFVKFNSNTGWAHTDRTGWSEAMQALSHYSYHVTGGRFLLCVVLSDPVIHSSGSNQYGLTDLGARGISSFFARHRCSRFCSGSWRRPANPQAYFQLSESTTMVLE